MTAHATLADKLQTLPAKSCRLPPLEAIATNGDIELGLEHKKEPQVVDEVYRGKISHLL